jgi:hypothetical protein
MYLGKPASVAQQFPFIEMRAVGGKSIRETANLCADDEDNAPKVAI